MKLAFTALLTVAVVACSAASASAHTYCVGVSEDSCAVPVRATSGAGVGAALADAQADSDSSSTVLIGSSTPIVFDSGVTISASHHVDIVGREVGGVVPRLQMSASGSMLSFDSSATGSAHGTISGLEFGVTSVGGAMRAVRVNNVDVHDCSFDLTRSSGSPVGIVAQGPTASHHLSFTMHNGGGAAAYIDAPGAEIDDSTVTGDGNYSEGFIQSDTTNHSFRRNRFYNVGAPLEAFNGTMVIQDSLIDLAGISNAVAASTGNAGETIGPSTVKLEGSTVVGSGDGQSALTSASTDPGYHADASIDSTIVDLTGAGAYFAFCTTGPGGLGVANVEATYSLLPTAANPTYMSGCTNTSLDTSTDLDIATHPAVYAGAGDYRPGTGSPAIDAGNPAVARAIGAKDLAGGDRIVGLLGAPRIDIGAYEAQIPVKGPIGQDPPPPPAPSVSFGKPVGKVKPNKKGANGFKLSAKKVKDYYIPVTSSGKLSITLTIEKPKGGFLVGGTCRAKQGKSGSTTKRCTLALKGTQKVEFVTGTSYLTFAGRWNKKLLAPGSYKLVATNPNMMPNRISMNVTVPKQK